jgi:hypothetical protein
MTTTTPQTQERSSEGMSTTTDQATSTVHMCPPDGEGTMPCCGATPFERYASDERMTLDPELVTCGRDLEYGVQAFVNGDIFEANPGQWRLVHFDPCPNKRKRARCESQYHHWGRGDHAVPLDADWSPR